MCHGAEQYRDIDTLEDLAVRADVGSAFFSPGLGKRLSRDRNREDLGKAAATHDPDSNE